MNDLVKVAIKNVLPELLKVKELSAPLALKCVGTEVSFVIAEGPAAGHRCKISVSLERVEKGCVVVEEESFFEEV